MYVCVYVCGVEVSVCVCILRLSGSGRKGRREGGWEMCNGLIYCVVLCCAVLYAVVQK